MTDHTSSAAADDLRRRLHRAIPGGAHTYAKGDDQWPRGAAPVVVHGRGARVWDTDGHEYLEYAPGSRAVTLGHAFPPVVAAAQEQLARGASYTRPSLVELEAAEALLALLPAADMVKFTKDGSTATTAAVRLARAHTGRELVLACGDHPFFSYDDWWIGTTSVDAGIPAAASRSTVLFPYGDLAAVEALLDHHAGQVACVLLEPEKDRPAPPGYLQQLHELCRRHGTLLVLDEMITGFRYALPGAQTLYDVRPDLSTFGKALANGFSVSALAGRRDVMERGGLSSPHDRVFLLSTTHGGETHALAAAIATMRVYEQEPVVETLAERGRQLRSGVEEVVAGRGLQACFGVRGHPANLVYWTAGADGSPSQSFRTLFLQELVRRGVLAPSFVVTYSHTTDDVERTIAAVDEALEVYARALEDGVERWLDGPPVAPVYRARNRPCDVTDVTDVTGRLR